MKKYPKIRQLGHEENEGILDGTIQITEKCDGANFRVFVRKGEIFFGSRTQELDDEKKQKNWKRCIDFVKDILKDKDLKKIDGLVLFGECMKRHSLNYNWDIVPPFLGFDVYNMKTERFELEPKKIFDKVDLPFVPIIKEGVWDKKITKEDLEIPRSKYVDNWAEGIMIKNYGKQLFAKVVSDKFKEENRKVFGGSKKYAKSDEEYYTLMFCTNPRIDKMIFKLIDEGYKLEMKMMAQLPKKVYADIWEENWEEISRSNKIIDMSRFRKLVTKRCLAVLRQMITNKRLEGK